MLKKISLLLLLFLSLTSFAKDFNEISISDLTSKGAYSLKELNFGVLVYNDYFKIYRSSGMGYNGLKLLRNHLDSNHLNLPTKIIYLNYFGFPRKPSASWVSTKSYALDGLQTLFDYAKGVFTLTNSYSVGNFARDEDIASRAADDESELFQFEFVHGGNRDVYLAGTNPLTGPTEKFEFKDDQGIYVTRQGNRESLYQVLKEILTHPAAVQFHCKEGLHRTGMAALMIRYLQGGNWIIPNVISVVGKRKLSLAEYEYLLHNTKDFRVENLDAILALAQDERFQCLKEKFSCFLNSMQNSKIESNLVNSSLECGNFDRVKLWESCELYEEETKILADMDRLERNLNQWVIPQQRKIILSKRVFELMRRIEHFSIAKARVSFKNSIAFDQIQGREEILTERLKSKFSDRLTEIWIKKNISEKLNIVANIQ